MTIEMRDPPIRVLFLDPDALLDQDAVARSWTLESAPEDAMEVFMRTLDQGAVERVRALVAETGATVVFATNWRLLWTVGQIAEMLRLRAPAYSGAPLIKGRAPRDGVAVWLRTAGDCGKDVSAWAALVKGASEADVAGARASLLGLS